MTASNEYTKLALSLVTASHLEPDRPSPELFEIIERELESDPEYEPKAIIGLINIATWLLGLLEKETGRPASEWLQHIGRKLASG
jgi:hypothetical protein